MDVAGRRPRPPPSPIAVLRGHRSSISHIFIVLWNSEVHVLSGDVDGTVMVWNLRLRRCVCMFSAHSKGILTLVGLENGILWTHGRDGILREWDLSKFVNVSTYDLAVEDADIVRLQGSGSPLIKISPIFEWQRKNSVFCKCVSVTGRRFAIADNESHVVEIVHPELLEVETEIQFEKDGKTGLIMAMAVVCDEPLEILLACESGSLYCWSDSNTCLWSRNLSSDPLVCVDVCRDRSVALVGSAGAEFFVVDLKSLECTTMSLRSSGASTISFRPDGKLFALAGWDGAVRVFHMVSSSSIVPLVVLKNHSDSVQTLAFGPGVFQSVLASGGKDQRICIYELYGK